MLLQKEKDRRVSVRFQRQQERARRESAIRQAREEKLRSVELTASGHFSVSTKRFFLLDRTHCGGGLVVSEDMMTVTYDGSGSGKMMALGTKGFRQGIAYWEVKVEHASWGSVFIGVAPKTARGWQGYGFLNYRAVQAYGSETLYGSYFGPGDTIGVLLDMERGTIAFIKDGEDFNVGRPVVMNMGVAYHYLRRGARDGVPGTVMYPCLYPCFGMKHVGDQLSIQSCKWYYNRGDDRIAQLRKIIDGMSCVYYWRSHVESGRPLNERYLDSMYRLYLKWKSRKKLKYQARGGGEIEVDCTKKSLRGAAGKVAQAYELEIGQRVTTPYGEGKNVGVARGDVWYSLDSEGGKVWYWTTEEFEELVGNSKVVIGNAPLNVISVEQEGAEEISRGEFKNMVNGRGWTVELDDSLVKLVNHASSRLGLAATHIPYAETEKALKLQALSPLREFLADHTIHMAFARFAAILWLNRAVSTCIALINLGTHPDRAVIITDHDVQTYQGIPAHHFGVISPMGQTVSLLRGSIFTSTKVALWNDVLTESTTATIPPADEYDRPEELREITLNRMQARRAVAEAETLPYEERLRLSLFGQLRDQVSAWEGRTLRRSFTHMQDAGQARAFFVKFVGEGVDDHGGPYRAVFETAVGEEPTGTLELFVPCPNAEASIGDNRDQVVIKTGEGGLIEEARLPLYFHLGRLIGVATRHRVLVPLALPNLLWRCFARMKVGREDLAAIDKMLTKALGEKEKGTSEWFGEEASSLAGFPVNLKTIDPVEAKEIYVKVVEQARLTMGYEALVLWLGKCLWTKSNIDS